MILDARSAFPNPGLLETISLDLFEFAFNGESKSVRDILMQRQIYVDICDSRGLTPLHFPTYNVHITIVNLLLDFGANVNQLTDDGLTPLTIAFLLYYGNNPQETSNLALEHRDPMLILGKATPIAERRRSSTKEKVLQQSRTTFNTPRNLLSQTSIIIDEDKMEMSVDSLKINEEEKKSKFDNK